MVITRPSTRIPIRIGAAFQPWSQHSSDYSHIRITVSRPPSATFALQCFDACAKEKIREPRSTLWAHLIFGKRTDWMPRGCVSYMRTAKHPIVKSITLINHSKQMNIKVVEAAGVEPASENVTGQETTCLF